MPLALGLALAAPCCVAEDDPAGEPLPADCGEPSGTDETLRLSVVAHGAEEIPPGRIAVQWHQADDDAPPSYLLAYDAPFDPLAAEVEIPVGEVRVPCAEFAACYSPCDGGYGVCACDDRGVDGNRIAFSQVVVVEDSNANGRVDGAEGRYSDEDLGFSRWSSAWMGGPNLTIAWAEATSIPTALPVAYWFPEGVEAGVHAYRELPQVSFTPGFGFIEEGDALELHVCAPGSKSCDGVPLPEPEL